MKALIDSADSLCTKAMFLFFAKTGIRRQELIDLDVQELYLSKKYAILKPHAKRSNRIVFFDNECAQVLKSWLKWRHNHGIKNPALFIGVQGGRSAGMQSTTKPQNTPSDSASITPKANSTKNSPLTASGISSQPG